MASDSSVQASGTGDPVLLSVVQGALSNIQEEMTATLMRSGRSNVATIARDFSNALFDGRPEMILQGQDIPIHLGSLMFGMRGVADYFGDDIHPGDVFYHNDPATGGSHLPDMCAFKPIFVDGELAFWGASKLHVVDAGGPVPSSYNIDATENYAEGLRIPPVRLVDKGVMRQDVLDFILANVRMNENQAGDLRAQLGAVGIAERRLTELCAKYGLAAIQEATAGLKDLADRQMRAVVRDTPDGSASVKVPIEDTGHGHGDLEITATATISGDELQITLQSPDQIPFYINSYEANTASGVFLGLLEWAQVPPPYNAGLYRCVRVDPGHEGSLTNAKMPAPCGSSTSCPAEPIADAVRKALLEIATPRYAIAEWGRTFGVNIAGTDPRNDTYFVNYMLGSLIAGAGAVDGQMDGWHMIGPADALGAVTCGDSELLELLYPIVIHEYSIRGDSGGAGEYRGGCGASLEIEPLGEIDVVAWGWGMKYAADGFRGAVNSLTESKLARGYITRADGSEEVLSENRIFKLLPGERYKTVNCGGGGCGHPFDRPPERVLTDVHDTRVSVEAARLEYGVVVDAETLELDAEATARHREQHRAELGAKEVAA